jgi:hypothetical protein
MPDTENPLPTDPPDNTGGGGANAGSDSSPESGDSLATDPPDNTGGGGSASEQGS